MHSYYPIVVIVPGCLVESFPCERKTLETQKKLQGNFMCWKGSKGYSPYTSTCPYYRQVLFTLPKAFLQQNIQIAEKHITKLLR